MQYNTLELPETIKKLDFKTHIMNLHGKRTRQCGTVMPGNEVKALQPTGNNVPVYIKQSPMAIAPVPLHNGCAIDSSTFIGGYY